MSRLAEIFRTKHDEVAASKLATPVSELKATIIDLSPTRPFQAALEATARDLGLIAEIKAASPSQGAIRPGLDPAAVAKSYADAHADCLSVLTDRPYFGGAPENIRIARESCGLPILRKDFIDDPYQVYEARAWGADCFLLIVAALEISQLSDLMALGREVGLESLVEVHSMAEAEIALAVGAPLIGVNNRDLSTFETSLTTSEVILPRIAPYAHCVSESALSSRSDLDRMKAAGAKSVLIGTTFCREPDVEAKVREVMGS